MAEQDWTEAEHWAWGEIKAGQIANFNIRAGTLLDPKEPAGWDEGRTLSPAFLKDILFRPPWREQIPVEGVRIVGAFFADAVDLAHGRLSHQLWLDRCRFERGADFSGLRVDGWLSLIGSVFLAGTRAAEGAAPTPLKCGGCTVAGHLWMNATKVAGRLNMSGLSVGGSLLMRDAASFQEVDLGGARIEGQLDMSGATLAGRLAMQSLTLGQHLFMDNASFTESIRLTFAHIGGNLDLRRARLSSLDLSATRIAGEFYPAARWSEGARLTLVNTHAGTIEDGGARDAWPKKMELDGFSYDRLGGFASQAGDMLNRPADWFCRWLACDPTYAPQPYEQLAKVLRASGQPEKADAILYASRERARKEAWKRRERGRWLGLSLLKSTIGYGLGHRYFRALLWVGALTALGAAVLVGFSGNFINAPVKAAFYSLDRLLPLVELDPSFDKIELTGWVQYIFMGYELIGYVLASFLVAGLAGLTQK